jgi:Spy/CpxP family protein refolding chaperone
MIHRLHSIGLKAGAAVLALSMAAGYASAQNTNGDPAPFRGGRGRGPGGPDGGPGRAGLLGFLGPFSMMASRLELSDGQKDQIKSIAQSHAEEWKALLVREQQARQAQQAAIAASQFDEVTIRQRSAELAAVDADISVARARARGELQQVLTADQQAKLKEFESRGPRGNGGRRGRA